MKRGSYGKPWRKPADGWAVPRKTFLGALYQHARPALNGITRFQNTTANFPLQLNQVGPPQTRPAYIPPPVGSNCETPWDNGLPKTSWIGTGANQYLPAQLSQQFTQNGTVDFGRAGRQRGFKNVQALRQSHGTPPWTSHDAGGCADTLCKTQINDASGNAPGADGYVPTYSYSSYESSQPTPSQTKYLTTTVVATLGWEDGWMYGAYSTGASTAAGSVSVDASSGKKTSSLLTTENWTEQERWSLDGGVTFNYGAMVNVRNISGGAGNASEIGGNYIDGWTNPPTGLWNSGATTDLDAICAADVHCTDIPCCGITRVGFESQNISSIIGTWNDSIRFWVAHPEFGMEYTVGDLLPEITSLNSYTGSYAKTYINGDTEGLSIEWTRTDTVYSWAVTYTYTPATDNLSGIKKVYGFSGSLTLSNPVTSADVNADRDHLLSFWPLNDDALYPFRTDGVWQVAPLMTRDETAGNISPLTGFLPATVNDLRSPITDINGNAPWTTPQNPPPLGWTYSPANNATASAIPGTWNLVTIIPSDGTHPAVAWTSTYAQMAWFDTSAYGFRFPAGRDQSNSAASSLDQFALTGKIFGMPMPAAFTNTESGLYGLGPSTAGAYQNFFDFRATIYKACQWYDEGGGGPYVDFYLWGHGEWLSDAIARTGAQLPLCATQWTNNIQAMMLPPYAYIIQADKQAYDKSGAPGPASDFHTGPSGVLAQKCCEIGELWPSYDFFRPAREDRCQRDETKVNCITADDGTTLTVATPPLCHTGDTIIIAGSSGGDGVFQCAGSSSSFNTITRGSLVRPLPPGFTVPSPGFVAVLRWPDCPAILGRAFIVSLAATTDAAGKHPGDTGYVPTSLVTINSTDGDWLVTGDVVDFYSTAITYDANGNRVSEVMTEVTGGDNQGITWLDDQHFTVVVAAATLATAQYIQSHGVASNGWEWDDTGRKGDFVTLDWTFDYRTPAEITRLTGATNCAGGSIALSPTTAGYLGFSAFNQVQRAIPFRPCCAMVIAITPNGETWPNAVVIPFPTFSFDDRFGARWQMEIEEAMTDLLWQAPARPCGLDPSIQWKMDDGTCQPDTGEVNYFAFAPLVEARIVVPNYGGNSETDTAPTPAVGIGYLSPVTNAGGIQPPGMIGYDPASGNPSATWTIWGYRLAIESSGCAPASCRFNYVGMENLACVASYMLTPGTPAPNYWSATGTGDTSGGWTP